MVKKSIVLLILQFLAIFAIASNDIDPVGARSAGMGRTGVAMPGFWSISRNQAGLAYLQKASAGIYYENRFLTKELACKTGAFAMPTTSGVFGVSASQFGYELYNENKFGIAYANKFGDKIAAGLQLDYLSTHIAEDYGDKSLVTFEAGIIGELSENLYFGTHIFNPIEAKITEYDDESLPANFRMGFSYLFGKNAIVNIDAEKDTQSDLALKTGLEYHLIQPIYIRLGIATNPTLNTFGFGVEYKNFNFDFASSFHSILGFSPQFSLVYGF